MLKPYLRFHRWLGCSCHPFVEETATQHRRRDINVVPSLLLARFRSKQSRIERFARAVMNSHALVHGPTGASIVTGRELGEVELGF